MPELTPSARRPGTFPPGVSGNPGGRPKGAQDRPWEGLDGLLKKTAAREAKHVVAALVAAARAGNLDACIALLGAFQRAGAPPPP